MVCGTLCKIDKTVCKRMKVMEEFSEAHHLMTVKKMLTGKELKDLVSFFLCIFRNLVAWLEKCMLSLSMYQCLQKSRRQLGFLVKRKVRLFTKLWPKDSLGIPDSHHEEISSYLIEAVFYLSLIKNFCNLQKCLVSSLNYLGKVPLDLMITYFLCSPHFGIKEISKIILILNFPISGL